MRKRNAARLARRRSQNKIKFLRWLPSFKYKKLFSRLLPFGIIALVIFTVPKLISIKEISCTNQYGRCSEVLKTKLSSLTPGNLFAARSGVIKILEKEFFVSDYSIRVDLPASLAVYAHERKAVGAFIKEGNQDNFILVDEEGVVISILPQTSLPVIVSKVDLPFTIGQKIPAKFLFSSKVLQELFLHYNTKLAFLSDEGLEAELSNGTKVVFPQDGDLEVLFGSLNLILSRLNTSAGNSRIEEVLGIEPSYIDLRFRNPVLR